MNRMLYKRVYRQVVMVVVSVALCVVLSSLCLADDLGERVQKFTLKNGLTLLVLERHINPTVSLYIRHRVGAVDEDSDKNAGTAHILEHMRFKGTTTIGTTNYEKEREILLDIDQIGWKLDLEKKKGDAADRAQVEKLEQELSMLRQEEKKYIAANEIDRLYTENGAVGLNASTGYDMTSYHVNLPANKIELWARIEADRWANPVFREFYSERNVVCEERRQTIESKPERKLMEQFLAAAFIVHPYRRPIIGWKSDMEFLNKKYMTEFFNIFYVSNRSCIAVVGDVSAQAVFELVDRYFGSIPSRKVPPIHATKEPQQQGERRIVLMADANPQLIIGYHKPTLPSYEDYVFDVIDAVLTRGRSSRLIKSLVEEQGIAQSVSTSNGFPGARYPNLFTIFATPRHPHANSELEDAIYKELMRLKQEPVTAFEIEKAKNQLRAALLRRMASNTGLASMLSYFETITGDYRYITQYMETIDKITPKDIMNAASQYLTTKNRTVALLEKDR